MDTATSDILCKNASELPCACVSIHADKPSRVDPGRKLLACCIHVALLITCHMQRLHEPTPNQYLACVCEVTLIAQRSE